MAKCYQCEPMGECSDWFLRDIKDYCCFAQHYQVLSNIQSCYKKAYFTVNAFRRLALTWEGVKHCSVDLVCHVEMEIFDVCKQTLFTFSQRGKCSTWLRMPLTKLLSCMIKPHSVYKWGRRTTWKDSWSELFWPPKLLCSSLCYLGCIISKLGSLC